MNSLPTGSVVSNGGTASSITFTALDIAHHNALTATLYFAVYKEAATGYLDFLYQIKSSKKGTQDAVTQQIVANFRGAAGYIDVDFLRAIHGVNVPKGFLAPPVTGETPPKTASLSGNGATVAFNFLTPFGPGSVSNILVVRTHAKGFRSGSTDIITRESSTVLTTFAPSPEPSTLVLFSGCFVGLAGWTGWRRWRGAKA
jgi:hypothetical protein